MQSAIWARCNGNGELKKIDQRGKGLGQRDSATKSEAEAIFVPNGVAKKCVDIGCGPNHTPERALDAQAATDRRTQRGCHSYMVKHGEVYKQTTKG
jgi:hypothetical protein